MERQPYKTKQKEVILDCLREHAGGHISVEMVHAHLARGGNPVGLTTIYRNLDRLVQEGTIIRYNEAAGGSAMYQYVGNPQAHREHYHLVCLCCGEMVHLDCSIIDEFALHIKTDHRFLLSSAKTVFYGYCATCAAGMEKEGDAKQNGLCAHKQ